MNIHQMQDYNSHHAKLLARYMVKLHISELNLENHMVRIDLHHLHEYQWHFFRPQANYLHEDFYELFHQHEFSQDLQRFPIIYRLYPSRKEFRWNDQDIGTSC